MDRIGQLVKEARDRWKNQLAEFRDYVEENLSRAHLIALQVSDLDRQVRDGGFRQWYYKGYNIDLENLISYCQEIGTVACMKVKTLLEHIREVINSSRQSKAVNLLRDNGFDDYAEVLGDALLEKVLDSLDRYNQDYYSINHDFLSDVEKYLRR